MHVKPDVERFAKIRVIGVGGAGCNVLNYLIESKDIEGVEFIAVNTDAQALAASKALIKIPIGNESTNGLGAGSKPEVGKKAAEESIDVLRSHLENADMIFVTAGMGGGTGTGAAPVIAGIASELGALTIGVVTRPFNFEGITRKRNAESGLEELSKNVDALITIPNQKLIENSDENLILKDAFKQSDSILSQGVQGIADLIIQPGLINVDFADVRTIMKNAGTALMGIGYGTGTNRAEEAAKQAIQSPLLDESIQGATGVLFNITGGNNITMKEVDKAATIISDLVNKEANIIFGTTLDETYSDTIKITVIATGFKSSVILNDRLDLMKNDLKKENNEDIIEPDNLSLLLQAKQKDLNLNNNEIETTTHVEENINQKATNDEEKKGILNFRPITNKQDTSNNTLKNDINLLNSTTTNENNKKENNDNSDDTDDTDLNSDYDKSFDIPAFLRTFKK